MNNTTFNFNKWNTILGWIAFGIALITYSLTVEPTMSFWDCGEYIATAAKLEVGHPPGAPLFQMMGAFFAMFAAAAGQGPQLLRADPCAAARFRRRSALHRRLAGGLHGAGHTAAPRRPRGLGRQADRGEPDRPGLPLPVTAVDSPGDSSYQPATFPEACLGEDSRLELVTIRATRPDPLEFRRTAPCKGRVCGFDVCDGRKRQVEKWRWAIVPRVLTSC